MATLLLIIIYFVFISMGLPDSLLGSSFPAIADNLNIESDIASYVSLVLSSGTIISSLLAPKLIKKIGTKYVVTFSVLLTSIGLLGFSFISEAYQLFLIAIPLGLGGGCIDCALNDYVAIHYKAIHMNWLHCSWGIGTTLSPLIISSFVDPSSHSEGWNKGVLILSIIQFSIFIVFLLSLPIWNKAIKKEEVNLKIKEETKEEVPFKKEFKNPILYFALLGFFLYTAFEYSSGLWISSFFNIEKEFSTDKSALMTSLFYSGIMVGRFISGLISLKVNEKNMIRIGEIFIFTGALFLLIASNLILGIIGVSLIGLGCAPIYPALIKTTQDRFNKEVNQKVISLEMAASYVGNLTLPPLFGIISKVMGNRFYLLPYYLFIIIILMILSNELINFILRKRKANNI